VVRAVVVFTDVSQDFVPLATTKRRRRRRRKKKRKRRMRARHRGCAESL